MTDHSERNDPQPYNRAEEQIDHAPSCANKALMPVHAAVSRLSNCPLSMKRLSINTTVQGHATRLIQPL